MCRFLLTRSVHLFQINACVYVSSLLCSLSCTAATPLCIVMYIDGEREVLTDHTFDLLCNKVSAYIKFAHEYTCSHAKYVAYNNEATSNYSKHLYHITFSCSIEPSFYCNT
jgi:hypothetical protein